MEVAEDIINNSHDLDWELAKNEGILGGQKVKIVFADHESNADKATTEASKLLDEGVAAITGAYNSGCSAAVANAALEYNIPMICGSSSSAALTDGTTYAFGSIFNRVAANDAQESDEFFEYLTYLNEEYDAGIENVAIAWINNSYGIHADEMFQKYAAEYGFNVVASESYDASSTSFDTEAAKIKESGADVVFQASYIGDLTSFAKAYQSLDFNPKAIICYCGGFQDASFAGVATDLGVNFYAGGQACTAQLADKLESSPTSTTYIRQRPARTSTVRPLRSSPPSSSQPRASSSGKHRCRRRDRGFKGQHLRGPVSDHTGDPLR